MNIKHILFVICTLNIYSCAQHIKVSIITSIYKGDQFIQGFMKDITQQTIFDQCELILINANSPGNEEDFIRPYLDSYPNIHYIKLDKDPGLYAVWNLAIKAAQGKYITNANLDDRLKKDAIEVHIKALDDHAEIDLVYSDNYITNVPNTTFESPHAHAVTRFAQFSKPAMLACLPHCHPVWRKTMHEKYGYFDERYHAVGDYEMWLRAVNQGAHFLKLQGIYGTFYLNPTTPCGRSNNSWEAPEVWQKYRHLFNLNHLNGHQIASFGAQAWSACVCPIH